MGSKGLSITVFLPSYSFLKYIHTQVAAVQRKPQHAHRYRQGQGHQHEYGQHCQEAVPTCSYPLPNDQCFFQSHFLVKLYTIDLLTKLRKMIVFYVGSGSGRNTVNDPSLCPRGIQLQVCRPCFALTAPSAPPTPQAIKALSAWSAAHVAHTATDTALTALVTSMGDVAAKYATVSVQDLKGNA